MNPANLRSYLPLILAVLLSFLGYFEFTQHLDRTDFPKLIALYTALFLFFWMMYRNGKQLFWPLAVAAFLFRILTLWEPPNLSQDFYRFIWDGELILLGYDPYFENPEALYKGLREVLPNAEVLLSGMGELSASHYSNYPPLNQLFFTLAALLGGASLSGKILALKLMLLVADVGILFYGRKLLGFLQLPKHLILLYLLNPFVIIELGHNLHFEGMMMFFFLGGLWFLFNKKWLWSALFIAASISIKLIPLMFLPLIFMFICEREINLRSRKFITAVIYSCCVLMLFSLSFTPFFSLGNLEHFRASVNLWFSTFEFNAGIYYLIREAGYLVKGYNIIGSVAPWIPYITIATVLILAFRKSIKTPEGLITSMLWAIVIYLLISTTVHPWYLITPLLLSILAGKQFVLIWTGLIMLSYYTYSSEPYAESALLLFLQYGIIYFLFIKEMVLGETIRAF
ncbi:DUF2029 domain-containing protein [Robertkochia marina]|uniref:DUF2029 domain-containing protein n=1 Tax=Robertkochia marina TaxID=1227945 RepID=A0A4S3M3W3_9FLAO|nr:glycosyltransferase 87 family protein [Robertkochia marina]THD69783.1 DUF2029 domain-containing protein [Robertkochia marina]TRZ46873.1 DUF2029 domain-containing protein [Robertkochia marina]